MKFLHAHVLVFRVRIIVVLVSVIDDLVKQNIIHKINTNPLLFQQMNIGGRQNMRKICDFLSVIIGLFYIVFKTFEISKPLI